ncbi:recombination mediator RecR [Patescibacteria group bacterium]
MPQYTKPIQELIALFRSLPGVGIKSAERFVFYLLNIPEKERVAYADHIRNLSKSVHRCVTCNRFDTQDPCSICADHRRDHTTICVVSEPQDAQTIEKTGEFHGVYHILGGALNAVEGITPDKLAIESLLSRTQKTKPKIHEIVIATNPDLEGESTAMYLARKLKNSKITVTRLARGLPMGSNIEYADEVTLSNALKGREQFT